MLTDYIENALKGKSESTRKTYFNNLKQFEEWIQDVGTDLESFSRTDVQHYIDYLVARKKSASTINLFFNALKSFCRWAGRMDAVEDLRVIKAPNRKKEAPQALNKKERLALLRKIDRSDSRRDFAVVVVLLNTGIRLEELVELDRDDVVLGERQGSLTVRTGKGYKEREIPLNVETRKALSKYLEERDDRNEALFLSNFSRRISKRSVQRILEKHDLNAHKLRHTFITQLVTEGVDIGTIQALTGHESADMILRYTWPTRKDRERVIENLYTGNKT